MAASLAARLQPPQEICHMYMHAAGLKELGLNKRVSGGVWGSSGVRSRAKGLSSELSRRSSRTSLFNRSSPRREAHVLPMSESESDITDMQETSAKPEQLSPKERRKLRNERREELKEKKGNWKEEVETKLDVKKKKPKGWEEILDINRLATKGYVWWMLSVPKNAEKIAADQVNIVFPERFPGVKYEVLAPSIPARRKLKDGRFSDARQRLYPGCLLVRCVLNREVYDLIKNIPRVYDFYGTKANTSVSEMIIPAAVSIVEIDELFARIEKEEAEFKILKEEVEREVAASERREKEAIAKAEAEAPPPPKLEEGALVQINAGPFINHSGTVLDIDHEEETLKLTVTVFGKPTAATMRIDQVIVLQGAI